MNRAVYTATSGGLAALARLETVAQNLANVQTAGYKAERVVFRVRPLDESAPAELDPALGRTAAQVAQVATIRDFAQGPVRQTDNPLDVAITGEGFFAVTTPRGERYTRQGTFTLDAEGYLATQHGERVQAENGSDLRIGTGDVAIGQDGSVTVDGAPVGRIRLVSFGERPALLAEGSALFVPAPGAVPTPIDASAARVQGGAIEGANVDAVGGMVELVDVSRSFEAYMRALEKIDGVAQRSINEVGRVGMIRALYTAATGMEAQQLQIDVIANNLANVNTNGFKKSRADFQDLLYQTLRAPGAPTTTNTQSPTGIQVGLGARPAAVQRINVQGDYTQTGNALDMAIEGIGFLQVTLPDGTVAFTRAGALKLDNQSRLVNSDGMPIEPGISIPDGAQDVSIGQDGVVSAVLPGQSTATQVGQIQTARFANPAGLRALGKNLLQETETSGTPQTGTPGQENRGTLLQGFLENSNVSVVEELVGLITGQRAYEVTSKAIQTADEMLRATNAIVR